MPTQLHVRPRRRADGFTLIELMVAVVLFSFAMAGILSVAVAMTNGFREQRLAIETETAARSAMDFLGDALRGASPGVESGLVGCATSNLALSVVDDDDGPDQLRLVYASGSVVTSTLSTFTNTDASLTVTDASQLRVGDRLLLTNFGQGHIVRISAISGTTLSVSSGDCGLAFPGTNYGIGTLAVRVQVARFYIDPNFLGQGPMLMLETPEGVREPLAEGIEDMQVALGRETDTPPDGIQGDEWIYDSASESDDPLLPLRAVRITLVARGREPLNGATSDLQGLRPGAENRPAAGAFDRFRRRTLTTIIEIRNLGGSP